MAGAPHACALRDSPCPRYVASAWAGFTGLQWRRLRELGSTINDLKAQRKPLQAQIAAAEEAATLPAALTGEVAALTAQIDELTETRKALSSDNLREKHYQVGSVILGLGTSFAIEGPVNTFLRAQKLFPGPRALPLHGVGARP